MKKVLVIACSGSGKSHLAKDLAKITGLSHNETDAFYWKKDWELASDQEVQTSLNAVLQKDSWILDGNFEAERAVVWPQADTILWLDYSFQRVIWQVTRRNLGWWLSKETTWSGNTMTFKRAYSGIKHSVKSYERKRNAYPKYLKALAKGQVIIFRHPAETKNWLENDLKCFVNTLAQCQ